MHSTFDAEARANDADMDPDHLQRKLAAILYADVAGYSRLTGQDEDATHRTLSAYLDVIAAAVESHHGRVVHYAGDAVLADFGTAADALTCAISVQRELARRNRGLPGERRVEFRIGINLGDVIVDRDDIYGDGVNVAARLESLGDPGGVCISGSVYDAVGSRVVLDCEFMGEQSVKNIAKPVRAYRVLLDGKGVQGPAAERSPSPAPRRLSAALAVAVVLVAALGAAFWLAPWRPPSTTAPVASAALEPPDRPSIAVLPFANLGGDASQDYFVDGISEDIITELARFPDLFVIARNSTFAYKNRAVNIQQVGRELGVRYVLEGSVRKAKKRVRVTAQLVDTASGGHVWAEKYDRELANVFSVQDEITRKIVAVLTTKIDEAELKRVKRKETTSLEAYDYFLRGREAAFRFTKASNAEARALYRQALARDPNYARAVASLAWTHLNDWRFGWSDDRERSLGKAFELAHRAIQLDDSDALAHAALGDVYLWTKENDRAVAELERAVALNPNYADLYAQLAGMLVWAGRAEEALAQVETAKRLNPNMPFIYLWYVGHANFVLRRYDEAMAAFVELSDRNPSFSPAHIFLAAIYGKLGRKEEAARALQRARQLSAGWSREHLRMSLPYKDPADLAHTLDGMSSLVDGE